MPRYNYIAKDKISNTKRGVLEAASKEEVVSKLQQQGLFVVAVTANAKVAKASVSKAKKFGHSAIKDGDLCQFAKQMSTLLSSGVTLLRALEITAKQTSSAKFHAMLSDITDNVKDGLSLTEAMAKYPRQFTSLWTGLVDTGEASGNLAQVLNKLAEYLEVRMEFVRKMISAMVYPAVLLVAAGGAMFFFMIFIMPKFQEMFSSMSIELPGMTLMLFAVSTFMKQYAIFIVAGVAAFFYGLKQWYYQPSGKAFFDNLQLNTPGLKNFYTIFYLERMASTLSILFESGVPIVYALDVAIRGVGNDVIEKKLMVIKENVKAGNSLAAEFDATGFFPPMIVEMTSIGEEVGKLPDMFEKISQQYKTDLETAVERFTAAFEPVMIIVMGIGVGVLVIALFMPMFSMSNV